MVVSLTANDASAQHHGGFAADALRVMEANWRAEGYTCPNRDRYPWQWLWDSCFHSIVWAHAGDERALTELASCFAGQLPGGFVPHMAYPSDPDHHAGFWGRRGWSSITQPPMFGHALAELARRGIDPPGELIERAGRGLWFLLEQRRRSPAGLVEVVHPWESGADDSPRWDDLMGGADIDAAKRRSVKGALLDAVLRASDGAAVANDECRVGAVSFSSLVAFNCAELAWLTGDRAIGAAGGELAESVSARWINESATWADDGTTASGSGRARTLEALTATLVDPDRRHVDVALATLVDDAAHGARYGPTGVHRGEPTYQPTAYWRGSSWPQLSYLLWLAATRHGAVEVAERVASGLVAGARRSGFAEYWHPDTAVPGGAVPQSWTTLAWVVAAPLPSGAGQGPTVGN